MGDVSRLIHYEDTVLHDAWKAAGGGMTFFGQVVTKAEAEGKHKYVALANDWIADVTKVLERRPSTSTQDWDTLARLYTKILERRDVLVRLGYGQPTQGGEGAFAKLARDLAKPTGDGFEKGAKWAAVGLVAILLIVLLK